MASSFMDDHKNERLDTHHFKEGDVSDEDTNCFVLHTACVLNEII